ncbi:MAG TPA: ferritin family protein [Armatimonadota bacterium]|jgi:rubrerythrin
MDNVLQVLRTALEIEQRGHEYYRKASVQAESPVVQAVFAALGHDEEEHESIISRYYSALESGQGWPHPDEHFTQIPAEEDRINEVFDKFDARREAESFVGAYEVARDFEIKTRDFYASQIEYISDPDGKAFFRFLADLEDVHAKMLQLLIDSTLRGTEET